MSLSGKVDAGVGSGDRGIVPLGDLAEENAGQGFRREVQLRVDARNVVGGNVGAQHRREMKNGEAVLVLEAFICSSFMGPSEAPKSTVPSVSCLMPPPEPID